jgi:hypothetical protein
MSRLNPALPTTVPRYGNAMASMTLSFLLLVGVCAFGCWLIGTRSIDTGTDTSTYAGFFARLGQDAITTRLEPGFVAISYVLNRLGLGVTGYQAALFALMLTTVLVSTRKYFTYLASPRNYLTFLSASLMLLYVSPMFVNASINAVRQGLAALLVFVALLSFQQRKWWQFVLYGAVACSLHSSSALYLLFAPALGRAHRFRGVLDLLVRVAAPGGTVGPLALPGGDQTKHVGVFGHAAAFLRDRMGLFFQPLSAAGLAGGVVDPGGDAVS